MCHRWLEIRLTGSFSPVQLLGYGLLSLNNSFKLNFNAVQLEKCWKTFDTTQSTWFKK